MDQETVPLARVGRALALMAASVFAIATAGLGYVHPNLAFGFAAPATAAYTVTALDFVDAATGWVVVGFPSGNHAMLHTSDGGESWTRQLTDPAGGHASYLKFFDSAVGVYALLGTRPLLHRTSDGGRTWRSLPALSASATVLSWSFVDSYNGWMLVSPGDQSPAVLYRTQDSGASWTDLGPPVSPPDQAFQVHFAYLTTGWLTTASSGPYTYQTGDFGETWTRTPLPAPLAGWPKGADYFVAVQPTSAGGAAAVVVGFPPVHGRTNGGTIINGFPPLTVRAYDGGRLKTYTYSTLLDALAGGPVAQDVPPNQAELSTVDVGARWAHIEPPLAAGAIASYDGVQWWWIGAGRLSTSADGGHTWTPAWNVDAATPRPGSLQVLDRDHAWFAAQARPALEATGDGGRHWRLVALPALQDLAATP